MCVHRKGAMLMSVALFYRRNDVQSVLLKDSSPLHRRMNMEKGVIRSDECGR